jgi:hypothetical protein
MPFIAAGGAILGGLLGGRSARRAAQTQADAQTRAAQLAAEEARFRPVGITTRFGSSNFQMGIPGVNAPVATDFATPEEFQAAQSAYQTRLQREGRVTGASYTLGPQLKALQDQFLGLAGGGLDQAAQAQQQFAPLGQAAQGLFGLGQQYLSQPADQRLGGIASQYLGAQPDFGVGQIGQRLLGQGQDQQITDIARQQFAPSAGAQALTSLGQQYVAQSPQEAAQQYMSQQQNLLAPSRERQFAQLQNQLFNTGRGGLAVGATGQRPGGGAGLGAANPEMEAYYNALAQQDAGLAAQAQQAGQQQTAFGAGLLGQGQALGQGQIGFGAGLLGQQQAQEAQRLGLGSAFTAQQQALEQGRFGFGADLLGRQNQMEQQRASFGAGLFGTGGNLLTQGFGGQAAALGPYQAYLQGATGLEALGQDPLNLGSALGGRIANPEGGAALLRGGLSAAGQNQFNANAFNPFASALMQGSQNPVLIDALRRGRGTPAVSGFGAGGFGAGVNPFSGEFMGSTEF